MKADAGCVWPSECPPGPYSTSTALMLLPGTFGSSCSYTSVTRALSTSERAAAALPSGMATNSRAHRIRYMVQPPIGRRMPPALLERSRHLSVLHGHSARDERKEVCVDDVRVRRAHAVRKLFVDLEGAVLEQLR